MALFHVEVISNHLDSCQEPPGTSNILQDSMMTKWRQIGDGGLPGYIETCNSIYTNNSMYLEHSLCQNQLRLLSGISNVLQDSKMTKWRQVGDGGRHGCIRTSKSIHTHIMMYLKHCLCQNQLILLSGTFNVLQDSRMTKWRHIGDG